MVDSISENDHLLHEIVPGPSPFYTLCNDSLDRLNEVLNSQLGIWPNATGMPILRPTVSQLIAFVQSELPERSRDVRLAGWAAAHIIEPAFHEVYDTLEIIFHTPLSHTSPLDTTTALVTAALTKLMPKESSPIDDLKGDYILRVIHTKNQEPNESWVRVALHNEGGPGQPSVALLFIERRPRQYEFSVDSFQIPLSDLHNRPMTSWPPIVAESMFGSFSASRHHLRHRQIITRDPEEVHGGCLLTYCHLIIRGFRRMRRGRSASIERYMCSRFFIDFRTPWEQLAELEYVMAFCLPRGHQGARAAFLSVLLDVVQMRTVCLANRDRARALRLILNLLDGARVQLALCCNSLHLEGLLGPNRWTLDQVYYGTHLFPPLPVEGAPFYVNPIVDQEEIEDIDFALYDSGVCEEDYEQDTKEEISSNQNDSSI